MFSVLYSGGIDSTVLAYHLALSGGLNRLILIDYGQASIGIQRELLEHHAKHLAVVPVCLKVDLQTIAGKPINAEVFQPGFKPTITMDREDLDGVYHNNLSAIPEWSWIEGRNTLFMMAAATHSVYNDCQAMYCGFQLNAPEHTEFDSHYRVRGNDITPSFLTAVNELCFHAFSKPFTVQAPFFTLSKQHIVQMGKHLRVDFGKTYSCEFYPKCGECEQCREVARHFQ